MTVTNKNESAEGLLHGEISPQNANQNDLRILDVDEKDEFSEQREVMAIEQNNTQVEFDSIVIRNEEDGGESQF